MILLLRLGTSSPEDRELIELRRFSENPATDKTRTPGSAIKGISLRTPKPALAIDGERPTPMPPEHVEMGHPSPDQDFD